MWFCLKWARFWWPAEKWNCTEWWRANKRLQWRKNGCAQAAEMLQYGITSKRARMIGSKRRRRSGWSAIIAPPFFPTHPQPPTICATWKVTIHPSMHPLQWTRGQLRKEKRNLSSYPLQLPLWGWRMNPLGRQVFNINTQIFPQWQSL